jgi:hypothetical protein
MTALNYDPADPDKMRLPAGASCGSCAKMYYCRAMIGCKESNTSCDWSPSRFQEDLCRKPGFAAGPWTISSDPDVLPNHVGINAPSHGLLAQVVIKMEDDPRSLGCEEAVALVLVAPDLYEVARLVLQSFAYKPGEGPPYYEAARSAMRKFGRGVA